MNRIFITLSLVIICGSIAFGQKWTPEIICSTDTLIIEPYRSIKYDPIEDDSLYQKPYKVVQCKTRTNLGFRIEFAISKYYYGNKTQEWIGQHGGPNFNFALVFDKFNFGFRFKPWTFTPKKEIMFNGQTLPTTAQVNTIKLDYYLGYSIDFNKLVSVEPYVGYNRSSFIVINETELNKNFNINKTGGIIIGTTFNKYIKLKGYEYLSFIATIGYAFVKYEKVHYEFDKGYLEWNLGIAIKGFLPKRYNKKIK